MKLDVSEDVTSVPLASKQVGDVSSATKQAAAMLPWLSGTLKNLVALAVMVLAFVQPGQACCVTASIHTALALFPADP